jgi:hypothetical protein
MTNQWRALVNMVMNLRSKYERQGNFLLTEKICAPQKGFFFCLLPSRSYLECIAQEVNVIPVHVSSLNWHITQNRSQSVDYNHVRLGQTDLFSELQGKIMSVVQG